MKTRIYFIQATNGLIKIGRARDTKKRLTALQIGSPLPLTLLAEMSGTFRTEQHLHNRFNHLRQHGEWFSPADDLLDFIRLVTQGNAEVLKYKPGAKAGPQPRLKARILMLIQAANPEKAWRPLEVARTLGEVTNDCGRLMRKSSELVRVRKGHYQIAREI